MELDTQNPLAEATARSHAEERATLAAKDAGRDLLTAVMLCSPDALPDLVRLARERVERLAGGMKR